MTDQTTSRSTSDTAFARLLDLIDGTKATDAGISPSTAIADAIRESVVKPRPSGTASTPAASASST